jgi:hypothetical protein
MVTRQTVRSVLLGRDVAVAYAGIVALYLVRVVGFQPSQIPAYLLIVAYDLVEVMLPVLTPYHPIGFPLFLYLLAIIGAAAARWLRPDDGDESSLMQVAGGVCLLVGLLSVLFAALVGGPLISHTDNPTPLAIAGATGIAFLVGAWWLLRHQSGPTTASA